MEKYISLLAGCHRQRKFKQWSIGDVINQMLKDNVVDVWSVASEATGHPITSLMQYARVAAVFPRRIRGVSFSCYQAIAGIQSHRKRAYLVNKTATEELSSEKVRQIVRKIQKKNGIGKKKLTLKITVDAYNRLRDTAIKQNTTVRNLVVKLLGEGK